MAISEILVTGSVVALFASITGGGVKLGDFEIPKFASKTTRISFFVASLALFILGIFYSSITEAVERTLSLQERKEWKAAEVDDNCSAFEAIVRRKGKFAAEAEQRLEHAEYKPAVEPLSFPLSLPWTDPPLKTEAAARHQLDVDSKEGAKTFCMQNAQLYNGENATGIFKAETKPKCERASGGYICTVSGSAKCTYVVPNKIKVCPK